MRQFRSGSHGVLKAELFETPFDKNDPVNTPSLLKSAAQGSDVNNDPVLLALANVVNQLAALNLPLNAKLGDLQFHVKNEQRISIPGGDNLDSVFNINAAAVIPQLGYMVVHGASWVMAVEFTEQGPTADAWLTYGQSHDPESEHYSDQTQLFSTGTWRRGSLLRLQLKMI